MNFFEPSRHRDLLLTASGLDRLVADQCAESDHADFKLEINRKDKKHKDDLRADGACLATAGEGYLVIGVDESRDGRNVAVKVTGIPHAEARALKSSVEALLGSKVDPPISQRRAWLVDLPEERAAVVVEVRGRARYPVSVEHEEGGPPQFWVRERGENVPLNAKEARLRRRDVELLDDKARYRRPLVAVLLVLAAVIVAYRSDLARPSVDARRVDVPPTKF